MASMSTVTVLSGANRIEHQFSGARTTVGAIRDEYANVLNIPSTAVATVNGTNADRNTAVRDGDEVSFTRPVGQKG